MACGGFCLWLPVKTVPWQRQRRRRQLRINEVAMQLPHLYFLHSIELRCDACRRNATSRWLRFCYGHPRHCFDPLACVCAACWFYQSGKLAIAGAPVTTRYISWYDFSAMKEFRELSFYWEPLQLSKDEWESRITEGTGGSMCGDKRRRAVRRTVAESVLWDHTVWNTADSCDEYPPGSSTNIRLVIIRAYTFVRVQESA